MSTPVPNCWRTICLVAVLLALWGAGWAQTPDPEKLRLEHADSLRYDRIGEKGVIYFIGNVFFRKGQKTLRCDRAIYYRDREVTVFRGNVVFEDSARTLRADYVEYRLKPETELARGHVYLKVDEKEIRAEELIYFVEDGKVQATGDVWLKDRENLIELLCGRLNYDRKSEKAVAELEPQLVKKDTLGQIEMTVRAIHLLYDGKARTATAADSVVINRGRMVATADSAVYSDTLQQILITGSPVVREGNQELSAKQMVLFVEGEQLRKAHLLGRGVMLSRFRVDGKLAADRLKGEEIWMDVEQDTLRHLIVKGQATSVYHVIDEGKVQGVNQVLGDEIELFFEGGKVTYVIVRSDPDVSKGKFHPRRFTASELSWGPGQ